MKKYGIMMAVCLFLLSGCANSDTVQAKAQTAPYSIVFAIPADTHLEAFSVPTELRRYIQNEGDYEITSESLPNQTAETLALSMTGRSLQSQTTICTERFGMPLYQFVWYTEEDKLMHRGAILEDTDCAYVLTFSVTAEKAVHYTAQMESVFSSFGLYTDELV